jgi:hypothetical protein
MLVFAIKLIPWELVAASFLHEPWKRSVIAVTHRRGADRGPIPIS